MTVTSPRRAERQLRATRRRWAAALTVAGLVLAGLGGSATIAGSATAATAEATATNPFQRGPEPTESGIEADRGPFATSSVPAQNVSGFGSGTIYFPTDTSQGKFGVVAIAPGFTASWSAMSWLGPRIASQGFVVIGINTTSPLDLPSSRGDQLLAALNNVVNDGRLSPVVDPTRLAVAGWSMGGGGTLDAALKAPSLKAAIAIAPWETTKDFSKDVVPSLIITGSADTTAAPSGYGRPMYTSISQTDKVYVELSGQGHGFTKSPNVPQARIMISWLKVFVDRDTRYVQFICPGPTLGGTYSAYASTCS